MLFSIDFYSQSQCIDYNKKKENHRPSDIVLMLHHYSQYWFKRNMWGEVLFQDLFCSSGLTDCITAGKLLDVTDRVRVRAAGTSASLLSR